MLRLEDVEIVQGDWRMTADLALEPGSATAFLGPSGVGQDARCSPRSPGSSSPPRGRILWDGRDLTPLPPAERPVTLLFQEHNLFAHLSAAQNVGLGLRPDLRLGRDGWGRVEAALAAVGLEGLGGAAAVAALGRPAPAGRARARAAARPAGPDARRAVRGARPGAPRRDARPRRPHPRRAGRDAGDRHPRRRGRRADRRADRASSTATAPIRRRRPRALLADPPPELAAYLGVRRG